MLKLHIKNPTKGDWASTCLTDIQELNLEMSFEEIKFMTKQKFTNILKEEIKKVPSDICTINVVKRGKRYTVIRGN